MAAGGESRRFATRLPEALSIALVALALLVAAPARAQAQTCANPLASLVLVNGDVEILRQGTTRLVGGQLNAALCAGDTVVVHQRSQAALLLNNATAVRLDQGTTVTLSPSDDQRSPLLNIVSGAAYVISRTPRPFRVRTPFINANVEGTEFLVEVRRAFSGDDDRACPEDVRASTDLGVDRITVFEGHVVVADARDREPTVTLSSGESATATATVGPTRDPVVRPRDAVIWTLYVPPILSGGAAHSPVISCAGKLIERGRLDEAKRILQRLLAAGEGRSNTVASDANALLATIAVAQNDKESASRYATLAIELDGGSATAWVARSYSEQASFQIADARASVQRANSIAPDASRAARLAELELALGNVGAALDAATEATRVDPQLARAHTVLGFAHLVRIEPGAATTAFEEAIRLAPADPLPRIGLGLTWIREGKLARGRESIEIAAVLDTENSLIRSYLGKAYFEEKRDALAETQLSLAKTLDPKDPTPWFYGAILKEAANQPAEALQQFNRSIELNDNRAVYRSKLLLDEDRATRQVNLAAIYTELASDREAVAVAADSVRQDPSNYSAHRFLSEAYATRDRHDIARTSELLQSQLLQPLSLNPVAPELPFTDVSQPGSAWRNTLFSDETTSLFERDRVQLFLGGVVGNLGTSGGRAVLSGLRGPLSASVGYFDYSTDGFRPNSDISHRIWNAFVQFAATPQLSLQAEYRQRYTNQGDVAMTFDPDFFSPRNRSTVDQHSTRVGATFRPTTSSTWIGSALRAYGTFDDRFFAEGLFDARAVFDDVADAYELQYQGKFSKANVVAGVGRSRVHSTSALSLDFTPLLGVPCDATVEPCDTQQDFVTRQWNGYVYVNVEPLKDLAMTVGVSRDSYDDETIRVDKWNPKLGLRFAVDPRWTVRAATFGTVKRSLITQQTIEPTQVVGFNQFYDDVVGSVSRFYVGAIDGQLSSTLSVGAEIGRQVARVATGAVGPSFTPVPEQKLRTEWLRIDGTSRASSRFIAALGVMTERFVWDATLPTDSPTYLLTTKVPLTLRTYAANGFFGEFVTTGVWQRVRRLETSPAPVGSESFVVFDASLGYRLPERRGVVSIDVKNLFGSRFSYQDDDFRSTESRLSPFLPVRRVWLKASLAF